MKSVDWPELKKLAHASLEERGLKGVYEKRLKFELNQIEQQGTNRYWTDILNDDVKFNHNKNNLLLPWLLNRCTGDADKDPVAALVAFGQLTTTVNYKEISKYVEKYGKLPDDIYQDDDKPDIDIDCLPTARDPIKEYAAKRYGEDKVASVGTWTTYLFKQALIDVAGALGFSKDHINAMSRDLPDDVNNMKDGGYSTCKDCGHQHKEEKCPGCGGIDTENPTLGKLIAEYEGLRNYIEEDPEHEHIVETAAELVGKVRSMSKHAGAIIISDRPLLGNVPMSFDPKSGQWSSMWTEGRSTQLSKFGYNKWDILGLRNLQYIYECCKMIKKNHGISFGDRMEGWYDNIDPENDCAGVYWKMVDGKKKKYKISLNDKKALTLANNKKTDGVFQFDTDLAKRILGNGVRSFSDLMIFNAMGHPGPMGMIPEYVARRDDIKGEWKKSEHKLFVDILSETSGVIVFQEQLQSLWQNIAGFTAPEAQSARKAVAKKWVDKLKPIRQKWIDGAIPFIGKEAAIEWWDERMAPFGRYAFNKSHSVAYCYMAYQCLVLKSRWPEEWWAAVMSFCHPDKLARYMNAARGDDVKFGSINIHNLTKRFTVNDYRVAIGLISLKGVGNNMCDEYCDPDNSDNHYEDLDDFIEKKGKNKTLLERLIKLGSFKHIHPNINATWQYYRFKYCSGKDITALKKEIRIKLLEREGWNEKTIKEEIERQVDEYKAMYPKRNKIPAKILNWKPKPDESIEKVMSLYEEDYDFREILEFEKQYLGYYWHSPADLYNTSVLGTVSKAKYTGVLHGVITEIIEGKTRKGQDIYKLFVSDGNKQALLILWESDMPQPKGVLEVDVGIDAKVKYDKKRDSFTLQRGTMIRRLSVKDSGSLYQVVSEDEFA